MPKANADWWRLKFRSIARRDRDTDEQIAAAGWLVVRIWEHEDPAGAARRIEGLARGRAARLQLRASKQVGGGDEPPQL